MTQTFCMLMLLAFNITLAGCTNATPLPETSASLGQAFDLKIEQSAQLDDGLRVTFVNVPTDGRCSSCTASYNAQVVLRFESPEKAVTQITLNTNPPFAVEGDPSPYTIKLINLKPSRRYPPDSINRADYVATLLISK